MLLEVLDLLWTRRFPLYRKAEAAGPDRLEWEPMWEIGSVVEDQTTADLMRGVVTMVLRPAERLQRRLSLMPGTRNRRTADLAI
jgi:hypothetical protein